MSKLSKFFNSAYEPEHYTLWDLLEILGLEAESKNLNRVELISPENPLGQFLPDNFLKQYSLVLFLRYLIHKESVSVVGLDHRLNKRLNYICPGRQTDNPNKYEKVQTYRKYRIL